MVPPDLPETALYLALLKRNQGARVWREIRTRYEELQSATELISGSGYEQLPILEEPPGHQVDQTLAELTALARHGITVLTPLSAHYPSNLRSTHDRPPFLFCRGSLPAHRRMVSVIGSRRPSPAALEYSRRLGRHLVRHGFCVVSGLAEGVDTAAHQAALEAEGETVAVIGTGITRYYPSKNRSLQKRLEREGAVLSQFFPDQPPLQSTFPMRNLVMAGMSLGTIIVEASEKSGTRIQARGALKYGRKVFFTRLALAKATWPGQMVGRANVHLIESPDDLYRPLAAALTSQDHPGAEQLAMDF